MKKRLFVLVSMLLVSSFLVASAGLYLKKEILEPLELHGDKSVMEVPFLAMKDPVVRYALRRMKNQDPESKQETSEPIMTLMPQETPEETTAPIPQEADFAAELAAGTVTERWFDDVLFIGDSRTVGLRDFARLGEADYFCSVGLTVFDVTTQQLSDVDFAATDLRTLLQSKRYNKIYISLGLNEADAPYELLIEAYGMLIKLVREEQPHAVIILQSLITVSRQKAASKPQFSLENLQIINAGIRDFADGHQIIYIDANEYFADEEGYLPSECTFDGCHFYESGYAEWSQWILENAKTLDISFG